MRIILLALIAMPQAARADDDKPQDVWAHPHAALAGRLGVSDPFGDAGVELEVAPIRWVSVAAGGGAARAFPLANGGSYSVATAVRGHVPISTHWDVLGGLGYSFGDWTTEDHPFGESPYSTTRWAHVSYWDAELGFEHHWQHVELRLYLGKSGVLAARGYSCQVLRSDGNCSPSVRPGSLGFIGIAVGYAFALL